MWFVEKCILSYRSRKVAFFFLFFFYFCYFLLVCIFIVMIQARIQKILIFFKLTFEINSFSYYVDTERIISWKKKRVQWSKTMLSKCCNSSSSSFEKFTTFGNYINVNFTFKIFSHYFWCTGFDVSLFG